MKYHVLALSLSFLLTAGCGSKIDDLKSETQSSTVPTTETDGVVTATVNPKADAKIVASRGGSLADSSIEITAGTLAIDTASVALAMGEAGDQTAALAPSLGFSAATVVDGTTALFVGPTGSPIGVSNPMVLNLPLPITEKSLKLTGSGQLALIYLIYTEGKYRAGIKPLEAADLRGVFINTEVNGLGFYRVIYLPTKVEAKVIDSVLTPSLKSTENRK